MGSSISSIPILLTNMSPYSPMHQTATRTRLSCLTCQHWHKGAYLYTCCERWVGGWVSVVLGWGRNFVFTNQRERLITCSLDIWNALYKALTVYPWRSDALLITTMRACHTSSFTKFPAYYALQKYQSFYQRGYESWWQVHRMSQLFGSIKIGWIHGEKL